MDFKTKHALSYIRDEISSRLFFHDPDVFLFKEGGIAVMRKWISDKPTDEFYLWDIRQRQVLSGLFNLDEVVVELLKVLDNEVSLA